MGGQLAVAIGEIKSLMIDITEPNQSLAESVRMLARAKAIILLQHLRYELAIPNMYSTVCVRKGKSDNTEAKKNHNALNSTICRCRSVPVPKHTVPKCQRTLRTLRHQNVLVPKCPGDEVSIKRWADVVFTDTRMMWARWFVG